MTDTTQPRRDLLTALLDRAETAPLTPTETALLRPLVTAEQDDADHAASLAAQLDDAISDRDGWWARATEQGETLGRRAEELRATLASVLSRFTHHTHPGVPCLQTGHIPEGIVRQWRAVLQGDQPDTARPPVTITVHSDETSAAVRPLLNALNTAEQRAALADEVTRKAKELLTRRTETLRRRAETAEQRARDNLAVFREAEAAIARVRAQCADWARLASPGDVGMTPSDTAFAEAGRIILADLDSEQPAAPERRMSLPEPAVISIRDLADRMRHPRMGPIARSWAEELDAILDGKQPAEPEPQHGGHLTGVIAYSAAPGALVHCAPFQHPDCPGHLAPPYCGTPATTPNRAPCNAPGPWGDGHHCTRPTDHGGDHEAHDGCGWRDEPEPQHGSPDTEPCTAQYHGRPGETWHCRLDAGHVGDHREPREPNAGPRHWTDDVAVYPLPDAPPAQCDDAPGDAPA